MYVVNQKMMNFRNHLIGLVCLLLSFRAVAQDHCDSVLITQDTTIFVGQTVSLQSHNLFEYTWLPETAFVNSHDSNQLVSPTETTTYHITGRYISGNIVTNGDFQSGK